jgi:hypothetical protein
MLLSFYANLLLHNIHTHIHTHTHTHAHTCYIRLFVLLEAEEQAVVGAKASPLAGRCPNYIYIPWTKYGLLTLFIYVIRGLAFL